MPYLEVANAQGKKIATLSDAPLTIGRSPNNALPIDEAQASRAHCVVEKTLEGHLLRDLDSRNGTWQDGEKIEQVLLADKHEFFIGATRFIYHHGEPPQA